MCPPTSPAASPPLRSPSVSAHPLRHSPSTSPQQRSTAAARLSRLMHSSASPHCSAGHACFLPSHAANASHFSRPPSSPLLCSALPRGAACQSPHPRPRRPQRRRPPTPFTSSQSAEPRRNPSPCSSPCSKFLHQAPAPGQPVMPRQSGTLTELDAAPYTCDPAANTRCTRRRGVAQPGRAPGSGPGGRRFESSLPDHLP